MENGNLWHLAMNHKASMFLLLGIQDKLHHSFRTQQGTPLEKKRAGNNNIGLAISFSNQNSLKGRTVYEHKKCHIGANRCSV